MRESSRQNNVSNGFEEKLNIDKQPLEPYADLKVIEDIKAKRFANNKTSSVINPRMGIIPTAKKPSSRSIDTNKEKEIVKKEEKIEPKIQPENQPKPHAQPKAQEKIVQPIKEDKKEELKAEPQEIPDIEQVVQRETNVESKPIEKPQPPIKQKEPPKEEVVLIEEQVESAVEIPKMPVHVKKPGVIEIKNIKGAPKNINNLDSETRAVIAKGLADGIKVYLIELGVYDVNRGYNASKLPHEITNFIRQTNNNRFNASNLASRFGVNLNVNHDDLEMVKHLSFKDLFDAIGENYPKSQIIRTTEDILSKDNNRFTIFEKKKMEELFEMNGIELPSDDE